MIHLFLLLLSMSLFSSTAEKCQSNYDELGIPHLEVSSLEDYYFCFGLLHGRDRAWSMDYFRRVAQGRNSEIYGFSSLKGDLMMRLLDLPRLAERLYEGLDKQNKIWLQLYAKGVNEGFIQGKTSREFVDLNYTPEEWLPIHSILILVLQSFDQTRKTFFRDYEEELLREKWKADTEELFDEDHVPWMNTILKEGEYEGQNLPIKTTYSTPSPIQLWGYFPDVFGKESGSNNWVVDKMHSRNGYAMLANDPHLDLKTPLFWYLINQKLPRQNMLGASVPGVPVIVSGTNGEVAWGLTNAYINTADAVFLKDLKKKQLISFRPTVDVKFGPFKLPFFFKSFERTKEGDIILPLKNDSNYPLALKWSGFNLESTDIAPLFNLIDVKNVEDMDRVLKEVGLPAWNFVFADTKGDIGYRVVGKIYRHHTKDSYGIPVTSWSDLKKSEFLTPEERPKILKPKRGYIYTANNRHWPLDGKFYGGRGYSYSFRGFRIDELLKDRSHDVSDFKNIQCDEQVVDARFFVPKLIKLIEIPEFKNWNFNTKNPDLAPSLYRRLMDLLMDGWNVNEYALYKLLDNLTPVQKGELSSYYVVAKKQVSGKTWDKFHRITFKHLSKYEEWNFSPELPGVGDNHSVNPGTSKWDTDKKFYEQYSGASMRMILVMKEKPEIHLALPGYNRNYTKMQPGVPAWNEWRSCEYKKIAW